MGTEMLHKLRVVKDFMSTNHPDYALPYLHCSKGEIIEVTSALDQDWLRARYIDPAGRACFGNIVRNNGHFEDYPDPNTVPPPEIRAEHGGLGDEDREMAESSTYGDWQDDVSASAPAAAKPTDWDATDDSSPPTKTQHDAMTARIESHRRCGRLLIPVDAEEMKPGEHETSPDPDNATADADEYSHMDGEYTKRFDALVTDHEIESAWSLGDMGGCDDI